MVLLLSSQLCAFIACKCVFVTSVFLLHLFYFCMLTTGIGRVSYGAFLGRCAAFECLLSFSYPSINSDMMIPVELLPSFQLYAWYIYGCVCFKFYASVHLFHCSDTNSSLHQKQHLNEWKAFPLVTVLCSSLHLMICSHRSVIHHDLAFPVESLHRHTGQLSSSLRHQILEAQVFPSKLLKTLILIKTQIAQVCLMFLWAFYLKVLAFKTLNQSGHGRGAQETTEEEWMNYFSSQRLEVSWEEKRKKWQEKDWKIYLVAQKKS